MLSAAWEKGQRGAECLLQYRESARKTLDYFVENCIEKSGLPIGLYHVDKEEIVRELDLMQEARIGGVELQILYPLQADDEAKGIHNYEYLSPGFMDMIRFAADEAAKRDMQFDLTLGSSWPFGGPSLRKS